MYQTFFLRSLLILFTSKLIFMHEAYAMLPTILNSCELKKSLTRLSKSRTTKVIPRKYSTKKYPKVKTLFQENATSINSFSANPCSRIIVSNDHSQILPLLNSKNSLVAYDIDDTLFTPTKGTVLGSSSWFYKTVQQVM